MRNTEDLFTPSGLVLPIEEYPPYKHALFHFTESLKAKERTFQVYSEAVQKEVNANGRVVVEDETIKAEARLVNSPEAVDHQAAYLAYEAARESLSAAINGYTAQILARFGTGREPE